VRPTPTLGQPALFHDPPDRVAAERGRDLPIVGQQADIVYRALVARTVLNPPESTGMPYWSLNPYVGCAFGCAYCYARYAHRYLSERRVLRERGPDVAGTAGGDTPEDAEPLPPWLAFERRIYVKTNAAEVLRAALGTSGGPVSGRYARLARGDSLVIGTATDPYQPAERHFRVTRGALEALAERTGLRIVIITKSALISRDVDILARIARRSRLTVHLSLITLDRDLARRIEPRAPTPDARLRALVRLREVGIDVGINVMPVLPGITDQPAGLEALIARVASLGATHVNVGALRLQSEARRRYLPFIEAEFPHLAARYRATYAGASDLGDRYRAGLARAVRQLCARHRIRHGRFDEERAPDPAPAAPIDAQLDLLAGPG